MKIFFRIDDKHIHPKYEFHGEYAVDIMLLAVVEIFYGKDIRNKVKDLINSKVADEELIKNLNDMANNIHKIQTGRY